MNKLIVVIMGPGKKHFAEMCLDSVKDADKILYYTSNRTLFQAGILLKSNIDYEIYNNFWDETNKETNGKSRNVYLEHLKEFYPDDWCLVLDEDELVDDNGIQKIKDFINDPDRRPGIYNVKMRHFIGDIGHEDAMLPVHVVPGRLFKISEAIKYPEHSHPIIQGELMGACLDTTIWHLGHLPVEYMDYILKRYKQHAEDSIIHSQDNLIKWKLLHLFGQYGKSEINPVELPKQILDRYELNRDGFYFADRNLEMKHFIDAIHWREFFKCEDAWELGCGRGPRVFAMNQVGIDTHGLEISQYAVDNQIQMPGIIMKVMQGDVTDTENYSLKRKQLVIAYDLLEHLEYKDLEKVIDKIIKTSTNHILISVPVLGNPNLEADSTHIIKEDKKWWIKKFIDKGLKLIPTPEHFLYKEQIMIFKK